MKKRIIVILVIVLIAATVTVGYTISPLGATLGHQPPEEQSSHWSRSPYIPDEVEFAGEKMPIERFDVRESLERELIVNMNFHSNTIQYLKRGARYFPVIEKILAENKIPGDFKYLSLIESDFMNKVSPKGATGFWQFMKEPAKEYGLEVNNEIDERYNLEKATAAACRYLNASYTQFGSWTMAAASYNLGTNGLTRFSTQQKNSNYYDLLLPEETMRYIFRIVAVKLILGDPEAYGFHVPDDERYDAIPFTETEISGPVDDWAQYAIDHGTTYKMFKMLNPWLRDTKLVNPQKKTYKIKLPK